jgi:mRNA export factor
MFTSRPLESEVAPIPRSSKECLDWYDQATANGVLYARLPLSQHISDDISQISFGTDAANDADLLGVCTWGGELIVYRLMAQSAPLVKKFRYPLLCCVFDANPVRPFIYVGSCDARVYKWNYRDDRLSVVGMHQAPVSCIGFLLRFDCVVSGSWDGTVSVWRAGSDDGNDQGDSAKSIDVLRPCAGKVVALDARDDRFVFATTDGGGVHARLYCEDPAVGSSTIYRFLAISSLKHQYRSVALFADSNGCFAASIEGRCAVVNFAFGTIREDRGDFSFKCHRAGRNQVYPVNSISVHKLGTFATAGGDGAFAFWDKDARQRLRSFPAPLLPPDANRKYSIVASGFNRRGTLFAAAYANDWSCGKRAGFGFNYLALYNVEERAIMPRAQLN